MARAMYLLPLLAASAAGLLPVSNPLQYSQFLSPTHGAPRQFFFSNSVQMQYPSQTPAYPAHSTNPSYSTHNGNQLMQPAAVEASARRVGKGRPTVHPARYFNPQQDADKLHYTLKSIVNPDVIIGILANRSSDQRQIIMQYYPDLKKDLHWKLSFDFRDVMEALMTLPQTFVSLQLEDVLKFSTSIDEKRLVELLGTLDNTQLQLVKEAYKQLYGRSLQSDLTRFSLDKFADFFSSYIEGNRDERLWVDHVLATKDAEALKKSGKLSIDNGSYFRYILTFRGFDQLNRTFVEYQRIKHESIEHRINKDFSGRVRDGLLKVVKLINNRGNYFAEILHEDMDSLSKRDSTLIRVIVLRSEIDMGDIKDSYERMYRNSLSLMISRKTSGSFKKALQFLISG